MKTNNRINEIMNNLKAFEKVAYPKSELLQEMLNLQNEMVSMVFNNDENVQEKRIWDVEEYFEGKNAESGHIAEKELEQFKKDSKSFCNLIRAEINGQSGEKKVFKFLDYLDAEDIVLKNVELKDETKRTELDAVVITPEAIVIVEVKNTNKDVFIDQEGYLYRVNNTYNSRDCNIAEKMGLREKLLRKVLNDGGFDDVVIRNVVVFTSDRRIELANMYKHIKTCFLGQLNYVIDGYCFNKRNDHETISRMAECIKKAETSFEYSLSREFDFGQFKKEFAELVARVEEGSAINEIVKKQTISGKSKTKKRVSHSRVRKNRFESFGTRVAAVASALSTVLINTLSSEKWKKDNIA